VPCCSPSSSSRFSISQGVNTVCGLDLQRPPRKPAPLELIPLALPLYGTWFGWIISDVLRATLFSTADILYQIVSGLDSLFCSDLKKHPYEAQPRDRDYHYDHAHNHTPKSPYRIMSLETTTPRSETIGAAALHVR
jgi:hypothetical protein